LSNTDFQITMRQMQTGQTHLPGTIFACVAIIISRLFAGGVALQGDPPTLATMPRRHYKRIAGTASLLRDGCGALHAHQIIQSRPGSARQLYLRFIALTAINPATILYFLALAIGLPGLGSDPMNAVAFTLGAAGASLSWQLLLGGIGAAAGRILPERAVTATRIVGQVLIIGFGTSIAVTALRSVA
jgi:hypothetical protein